MPHLSPLTDGETEAQRGEAPWPRVVDSKLGLQTRSGNLFLLPSSPPEE